MRIEPMGSIPRPPSLIEAGQGFQSGRIPQAERLSRYDFAVQHAMRDLELPAPRSLRMANKRRKASPFIPFTV
jgi:hypothetical protein